MTGLTRCSTMDRGCGCGIRQHQGREGAEIALGRAVLLNLPGSDPGRLRLAECPRRPGVWHLTEPPARHESFPPAVTALIDARGRWCVLCGSPRDLHRHHRRIRGTGGDPRPHAGCACNGLLLCARDHAWVHDTAEGREQAEEEGLIIPRSTVFPGSVSVLIRTADGGVRKWLPCAGGYADEQPGEVAA